MELSRTDRPTSSRHTLANVDADVCENLTYGGIFALLLIGTLIGWVRILFVFVPAKSYPRLHESIKRSRPDPTATDKYHTPAGSAFERKRHIEHLEKALADAQAIKAEKQAKLENLESTETAEARHLRELKEAVARVEELTKNAPK